MVSFSGSTLAMFTMFLFMFMNTVIGKEIQVLYAWISLKFNINIHLTGKNVDCTSMIKVAKYMRCKA